MKRQDGQHKMTQDPSLMTGGREKGSGLSQSQPVTAMPSATTETPSLLPCPFCGNPEPEIRRNGIGDSYVICDTDVEGEMCCGASSSECGCETDAGAISRWNLRAATASPAHASDEVPGRTYSQAEVDSILKAAFPKLPGKPTEHLSDLRESGWVLLAERVLYVDRGRETILCDRLPSPVTLVIKLADALSKADAILALGEGSDSSVARADMTPPSGASDGLRKSEEGQP